MGVVILKNKFVMKSVLLSTCLTFLGTTVAPVTSVFAKSASNPVSISQNVSAANVSKINTYISSHQNGTTSDFIKYVSTLNYNNASLSKNSLIQPQGVVGYTLKAIKAFGYVCRIGGKALKYAIRPLSPSKARLIDHYARRIAYATEQLSSGTRSALVSALHNAGVPGKIAENIADIIMSLI